MFINVDIAQNNLNNNVLTILQVKLEQYMHDKINHIFYL